FIDHAETISKHNIDRIVRLGGGIAIQHRMAFQGEYFRDRYGAKALRRTPPIREMLNAGLPVGAGTDATRVASYNPFVSLYWLVTGRTLGGLAMYDDGNRLDRMEALRLWTVGSSWFSSDQGAKGAIVPGQLGDLAVISADYFSIPEEEIKDLESVLTIVGGKVVYGAAEFENLAPPAPAILPEWSPVGTYGRYAKPARVPVVTHTSAREHVNEHCHPHRQNGGSFGCQCWAF
ncbi:MAG TPA: amidohydrolase family protein, partial [Bryobacteraceae bacterium]|nr:amidohydrolase family protein [Bryobacteraceae bacterium]